jgi:hypothetical protein
LRFAAAQKTVNEPVFKAVRLNDNNNYRGGQKMM